jgi:hypothetical protein
MRGFLRVLLGVIAHIPIVGVFGLAFWMVGQTAGQTYTPADLSGGHVELSPEAQNAFVVMMAGSTAIALFQMLSAIAFIVHAVHNQTIGSGFKVAWSLLVVFVGSIAQPLYFWFYVFRDPRPGGQLPGAPTYPYPPPGTRY